MFFFFEVKILERLIWSEFNAFCSWMSNPCSKYAMFNKNEPPIVFKTIRLSPEQRKVGWCFPVGTVEALSPKLIHSATSILDVQSC